MRKTLKAWTALGAAMATTTAAMAASPIHKIDKPALSGTIQPLVFAAGEGGEAGEGGSSAGSEIEHDVEFLENLGLVAGHLTVGAALYAAGEAEQAKTHMKHPKDEIYADLVPEMEERGVPGFADELAALAAAVESGADAGDVQTKLEAVLTAIDANGAKLEHADDETEIRVHTIVELVRQAGGEYAEGVKDGKVVEAHEYQDAWGFIQAAKRILANVPADERAEHADAFGKIAEQLNSLDKAWPDIAGKMPLETDSTLIAAAAAHIELAALSIK